MTLLVDSNVWIAAHDGQDPDHEPSARLLIERAGELIAPVTVIAEAAWFIEDRFGPAREADFVRLVTTGAVGIVELTTGDWRRCVDLIEAYAPLGLGIVDASVVAVAERLGLTEIATMNGRDFYAVRPAHCNGFTLLPEGLARS